MSRAFGFLVCHCIIGTCYANATACRYTSLPTALVQLQQSLQYPDDPTQLQHYQVVLVIDGFVAKIQRGDSAGDAYFGRQHGMSCDAINVQYVTDKHVITGLTGSTHDKTAAARSVDLRQFFDNLPAGYVVLGDPCVPRIASQCHHDIYGEQSVGEICLFQLGLHKDASNS